MRQIITHAHILTMNANGDILPDGSIVIEDGRIKDILAGAVTDSQAEMTDARGMLLLPGFINTHTHLPMVLFRGYADDLPLQEWLKDYIFPAEARWVTPDNVRLATRLALIEMIKSGTTCFNDMYFFEQVIAEEAARAGIRGVVCESLIDFPTPDFKTLEEGIALSENLISRWQNHPLIRPAIGAHSPYTCSAATLQKAKALADKHGALLQIHLAETRQETETSIARTGKTPAAYLHSLGVLGKNVIAAHGVWLTGEDIRLLAESGTAIAHCPKSNLKLASGIARIAACRAAGIPVGIGTDGAASNNSLDMVEEMRFASLLAKGAYYQPEALDAPTTLRMATLEGAKALGMDHITGSIEKGKSADLILVHADASNMQPLHNPCSAVVYAMNSKNIRSTMVAGTWLMKDRILQTIDKDSVMEEIKNRRHTDSKINC